MDHALTSVNIVELLAWSRRTRWTNEYSNMFSVSARHKVTAASRWHWWVPGTSTLFCALSAEALCDD
jgi:hypothetical protein